MLLALFLFFVYACVVAWLRTPVKPQRVRLTPAPLAATPVAQHAGVKCCLYQAGKRSRLTTAGERKRLGGGALEARILKLQSLGVLV